MNHLAKIAPGRSIEVRIPPYAAVQVGDGPKHSRGNPPNVVEMSADTWLALVSGEKTWAEAEKNGLLLISGSRSDISRFLPFKI